MIKKSSLTLLLALAVTGTSLNINAQQTNEFFADASITGSVGTFMRDRRRASVDANGKDTAKKPNLDHGSAYLGINFNSGYYAKVIGFDFSVYATADMWQNASPDHEFNFWGVNNPYDKSPTSKSGCSGTWVKDCNSNGVNIQTAALKFKLSDNFNAKLGYFQPSVPSALGVNWSFAAGTYTGGEVGANFGDVSLGLVVADHYRAPWFKNNYGFRTGEGKDGGLAYSLGAQYQASKKLKLDVAIGKLTRGDRSNGHIKVKYNADNGWLVSPQLYVVKDDLQFDKTAFQLALLTSSTLGPYTIKAEATYTSADSSKTRNNVGNFSYRLTEQFGASSGAYDIWWNNRSDFNHDGQTAIFGSLARDFTDMGAAGFSAGASAAYSRGAKSDKPGVKELVEYAGSLFMNYKREQGPFKEAKFGLHYTRYVNDSNAENWGPYSNAFQDESDIKITFSIPFIIK